LDDESAAAYSMFLFVMEDTRLFTIKLFCYSELETKTNL